MGLDWNPGPKATPGHEQEFQELWHKLQAKSCWFRARKVARFHAITTSASETLGAPRVGFDAVATDWAKQSAFPKRKDKSLTEETFIEKMKGFQVIDLVPDCDGVPRYSNGQAGGYVEGFSFRAQFLKDCSDIIGTPLLESAWNSKLPKETIDYGEALLERAQQFANAKKIDVSKCSSSEDPESPEFHLDIILTAGRWCRFWGERGHWLEAYF